MLLYQSTYRLSTLVVRIFISFLAVLLFLTGILAMIGMLKTQQSDTTAMVFVFVTVSVGFIIFKVSGWNIRKYKIYDDRLDILILGGVKTISYPVAGLKAFNDLRVFVMSNDEGIGIMTTDNKIIKIVAMEINDFPVFIDHLQKIVKWDLTLKQNGTGA